MAAADDDAGPEQPAKRAREDPGRAREDPGRVPAGAGDAAVGAPPPPRPAETGSCGPLPTAGAVEAPPPPVGPWWWAQQQVERTASGAGAGPSGRDIPACANQEEEEEEEGTGLKVSIITAVRNGAAFLPETAHSVLGQTYDGPLEWVVFDDGSSDGSRAVVASARAALERRGIRLLLLPPAGPGEDESAARPAPAVGAGAGRNRAIAASEGAWLCFLDGDDVAAPGRVAAQLQAAHSLAAAACGRPFLVGCMLAREPEDATPRYTAWLRGLSGAGLYLQWLRELTLPLPTWFMPRAAFDAVRAGDAAHLPPSAGLPAPVLGKPGGGGASADGNWGFVEAGGAHNAEDLRFWLALAARGGLFARAAGPGGAPLLTYRHHAASAVGSRGVPRELLFTLRVEALQAQLLPTPPWRAGFTIWSAGREGRRLYRALRSDWRKVLSLSILPPSPLSATVHCPPRPTAHTQLHLWASRGRH